MKKMEINEAGLLHAIETGYLSAENVAAICDGKTMEEVKAELRANIEAQYPTMKFKCGCVWSANHGRPMKRLTTTPCNKCVLVNTGLVVSTKVQS